MYIAPSANIEEDKTVGMGKWVGLSRIRFAV